jgi:glycosyltransferase involved in cell wall biosynthesis
MAVCEALMLGMPVVALATTEMPTVLEDGRSGIVHTDPARLIDGARALLADPAYARRLGEQGRAIARERFSIERFCRDWDEAFREVVDAFREDRAPSGPPDRRREPAQAATAAADARRREEVPA